MSAGVNPADIDAKWSVGRGKKAEALGRTETRFLRSDTRGENEFHGLVHYLMKGDRADLKWLDGKKRWTGSRNLKQPRYWEHKQAYSKKRIEKWMLTSDVGRGNFAKKYPNYDIIEVNPRFNEEWGAWFVYLKLKKKKIRTKNNKKPKNNKK
jgi:hypothetical protein